MAVKRGVVARCGRAGLTITERRDWHGVLALLTGCAGGPPKKEGMDMTDIDYTLLPGHLQDGMRCYIERHVEPGGFLRAVLENNLVGAFSRADHINRKHMFEISCFLYNEAPSGCWGSPERVKKWIEGDGR